MQQSNSFQVPAHKRAPRLRDLDWAVVLGITAMHLGVVAAPFFFSWSGLWICLGLIWLTGAIGITLTYHRLLTHRSFRVPRWLEYTFTIIGCMAWQGGPVQWVGVHRIHHKESDTDADPHTPRHGFTWAHMFWCMVKNPASTMHAEDAARDLQRDPGMRWINKLFWLPQFGLSAGLLFAGAAIGGWTLGISWLVWGVAVRTVFVYHGTWFVNSASHTWGYRNFETTDGSRNLWWVGLIGFGEGWHNNHHAHQRSAAHGLKWYEFDFTWWTIRFLKLVGLARDVKLPKPEQMP